jgi:hypothetical protein
MPEGGQAGLLEYPEHVDRVFYISGVGNHEFVPQGETSTKVFYSIDGRLSGSNVQENCTVFGCCILIMVPLTVLSLWNYICPRTTWL